MQVILQALCETDDTKDHCIVTINLYSTNPIPMQTMVMRMIMETDEC